MFFAACMACRHDLPQSCGAPGSLAGDPKAMAAATAAEGRTASFSSTSSAEDDRSERRDRLRSLVHKFTSDALLGVNCTVVDQEQQGAKTEAVYKLDHSVSWLRCCSRSTGAVVAGVLLHSINRLDAFAQLPGDEKEELLELLGPSDCARCVSLGSEQKSRKDLEPKRPTLPVRVLLLLEDSQEVERFITCVEILRLYAAMAAGVDDAAAACAAAAASGELIVVLDFDRTITASFTPDGQRVTSAHGVLEVAKVLSESFRSKTKELFGKYYPIEIDASMSIPEKIPIMSEWYAQVHALMLKEFVTRENIASAVSSCPTICLREGMLELLRCHKAEPAIPVLIMSAGLGDVIEEFLRQTLPFSLASTTLVVSNRMVFDEGEGGRLVDFSEPLLHMFNKSFAFWPEDARALAVGKKRCLLPVGLTTWLEQCGDGLGDCTMVDGLDVETLKVGFLNEKIEERLQQFREGFDVVVTGDGPVPEVCMRAIGASAAGISQQN
ncbi:unnamed protein product [Polarella glacialis]|uniref:5'-nucleotidase n=1 Tax=Polarella glacialis TaxID=89957 RepID=A0A813JY82_POLGL|nr:unnamed protein product [Polarella glacialis]